MKDKNGFSLIEVMVGLAVMSIMVTVIWQISSGTLDSQERVTKRDDVFQTARVATERVVDDLSMAFLSANSELLGKNKDGSNIKTGFIGQDKGEFDSLDFDSFSNWRMFRNSKVSDQVEVGYFVEQDPENKDLHRLMRRLSTDIDDNVQEGGKAELMVDGINEFQLEYYDGRQFVWTKEWNSEEAEKKNQMPRAVKITISFPDPDNADEKLTFTTMAFIELWQFPVEF